MAKKKQSERDILSDFFGDDDVDWMEDDETVGTDSIDAAGEESALQDKSAVEAKPESLASAVTEDPPEVETVDPPAEDGPVEAAPTPSDEPAPESESEESVAAPEDSVAVAEDPVVYEQELKGAPPPPPPTSSGDPAPESDESDAESVSATPQFQSVPALEKWEPSEDGQDWAAVSEMLVREAESTEGEAKGRLLYEAGVVSLFRLGDKEAAGSQFLAAKKAGLKSELLLRELASFAQSKGDWAQAIQLLVERGKCLEGDMASDIFQDAAMLANQHLNQPEIAAAHLESAMKANPDNYSAISLYRDQLAVLGRTEERLEVLRKIAGLTNGRVAAEAYWELGRLLQRMGKEDEAAEAYETGRRQDLTHGPNLIALEQLYRARQSWEQLGDLYEAESTREGQDAVEWWSYKLAGARALQGDNKGAIKAFKTATAGTLEVAHRSYQVYLIQNGDYSGLAKAISAELERYDDGDARLGAGWYRLGQVKERQLDDPSGALKAYQNAVSCDPQAVAVSEAVARVMLASGKTKALIKFWESMLEDTQDKQIQVSIRFRMGELAEANLGDAKKACGFFESILEDHDPHFLPALEALQRVYRRLKQWEKLAGVFETLAELSDAPVDKAQHLTRAGNVCRYEAKNTERAMTLYRRALEVDPGYANALEEILDLLEAVEQWEELANTLRAAADNQAVDASKVSLYYRAGRVFVDRLNEPASATACFQRCRELAPDFLPAMVMLKQIAVAGGDTSQVYALYKSQAETASDSAEKQWWRLAASDMASGVEGADGLVDLTSILSDQANHPGAFAAVEIALRQKDNRDGLLDLYRNAAALGASSEVYATLAELSDGVNDPATMQWALEALANSSGLERPGARMAESRQLWPVAASLLEGKSAVEDRLELARLQSVRLDKSSEALNTYKEIMDGEEGVLAAALGAARVGQQIGDPGALKDAHAKLSEYSENKNVKAAHALWTAQLLEAAHGDLEEIGAHYRRALDIMKGGAKAFSGVRRSLLEAKDGAGLRALYKDYHSEDWAYLLYDLGRIDDQANLREALGEAIEASPTKVGLLSHLEILCVEGEDWRSLYDVYERMESEFTDQENIAKIGAKKRWLLAEKLAETDEAWHLYQRLHEQVPEDREVTEALARIAGVRGQTDLGIQYLTELAESASEKTESARYQLRIGEVYEAAENLDSAKQAFLNALDHLPSDRSALGGLKRIALAEQDWAGLVQVLQREAGLLQGPDQLDLLREIARVTQDELKDSAVAIEHWRKVLEQAPEDLDALKTLTSLAEGSKDWGAFVECGAKLVGLTDDEGRSDLAFRIGSACLDHLEREDGLEFLAEAVRGETPHAEAAERLRSEYETRNNWPGVADMLQVLVGIATKKKAKLELLEQLADLTAKRLKDEARAAHVYEQIVEEDDSNRPAIEFLATYHLDQSNEGKAADYFDKQAAFVEEGADLDDFDVRMELSTFHFQRGVLLANTERVDGAIIALERALELNGSHAPSLKAIGPLYTKAQNWKAAQRVFRQLLQLTGGMGDKKEMAEIYTQLGRVEFELGSQEKANKRFSKALELYPNHIGALKGLSSILEQSDEWEQLLTVHNNIIYHGTDPKDVIHSYMTKGRILDVALDRAPKAAQHYVRSLQIDPNQPVALLRLAELALRREDWYEAGGYAQRGLQLVSDPGPLRADLLLSWAVAKKGTGDSSGAEAAVVDARACHPALKESLGDAPLDDLEGIKQGIRERVLGVS